MRFASVEAWSRLVSHGQREPERSRLVRLWMKHVDDMRCDGRSSSEIRRATAVSGLAHVWWRLNHGERTTIPCGVALLLAAIGTGLFAFDATTSEPVRVKVHVSRPRGAKMIGLGSVLIGLGDIEWAFFVDSSTTAATHLATGLAALLAGVYVANVPLRMHEANRDSQAELAQSD